MIKVKSINMKIFRISIILVTFLSVILFQRCVSDTINLDDVPDEANRTYAIDVPGATIHGTAMEIFEELDIDSIIEVDEDGLLYFYYDEEFVKDWESMLALNEISNSYYYDMSSFLGAASLGFPVRVSNNESIVLTNEEDVRLDTVIWKAGEFNFTFSSSSPAIDSVIITIPQLYINDEIFTDTIVASELNDTYSIDLTDTYMDFTEYAGDVNSINLITDVIFSVDAGSYSSAILSMSYEMTNLGLDKAIGYFGSRVISDDERTLDFDAFDNNYLTTDVVLKDLLLEVHSENTFGVPVEITSGDIIFTNTDTNEDVAIVIEDGNNIIDLDNYIDGSSVIPTASLEINRNNSNLEDLLNINEFAPNKVSSHIQIIANPDDADLNYFITDTSNVKTTIRMNVPLWFKSSTYTRSDTIAFDYNGDIDDDEDESLSDKLEKLTVNFNVENGLPFDLKIQVYFTDADYNVVDQLFSSESEVPFIESAVLDDQDRLSEPTTSSFEAEIDNDRLELWSDNDIKHAIIKVTGATDGEDYVKLCEDNYISINLSLSAEGKLGE